MVDDKYAQTNTFGVFSEIPKSLISNIGTDNQDSKVLTLTLKI